MSRSSISRPLLGGFKLGLQARGLDASLFALLLGPAAILGGGGELAALVGQRVGQPFNRAERRCHVRRRLRRLRRLSCRAVVSRRFERGDEAPLGHRCDTTVVSRVADELAAVDHPLDGASTDPKRFGCLVDVNDVVGFAGDVGRLRGGLRSAHVTTVSTSCRMGPAPGFGAAVACDTRDDCRVACRSGLRVVSA